MKARFDVVYETAWNELFHELPEEAREVVLNAPDGEASAQLALKAWELAERVTEGEQP